jgi:hypothetical protein
MSHITYIWCLAPFHVLQEDIEDLLKGLGGNTNKPVPKPTVADLGQITLRGGTSSRDARILDIGEKNVRLEWTDKDGKTIQKDIPIAVLCDDDRDLIEKLRKVPPNIIIDTTGLPKEAARQFIDDVLDAIDRLSKTPTGKGILDGIDKVINPPPIKFKGKEFPSEGNPTPIRIVRGSGVSPSGFPDSEIDITHVGGRLDPTVSPRILYNPDSGFAGLGKELWHGQQQIGGGTIRDGGSQQAVNEWDRKAASEIADKLREEANRKRGDNQ